MIVIVSNTGGGGAGMAQWWERPPPTNMVHIWLDQDRSEMKPWSQDWLIAAGAYPSFCSMKRLEVFLLPLDGMLVHHRSLPCNLSGFSNNLPVPIYTLWGREALWELSVLPKNTTQYPRPGFEPRLLTTESSTLTMRLSHLPLEDLHENQLLLIWLPL